MLAGRTGITFVLLLGITDSFITAAPLKLLPSDVRAGDHFGSSCAIDGDVIVAGAWGHNANGEDAGAAYVFRRSGSAWTETKLFPSNGTVGDAFGANVAIEGEVIVIGAYGDDDQGENAGAAYVFRYDGLQWTQEQKLVASDGEAFDSFGSMVRILGDVIVIGASAKNLFGLDSGAAYVFRRHGLDWVEEQRLFPDDAEDGDYFGVTAGLASGIVVVGADGDDDIGQDSGSAYVFRFDGLSWVQEQKLTRAAGEPGDQFGNIAAFLGTKLLIGAPLADDSGIDAGLVAVFDFDGSTWVESSETIHPPYVQTYAQFGYSLGASEGRVAIGALYGFPDYRGAAYVFERTDIWEFEEELYDTDGETYDYFGGPTRVSGSLVLVGASEHDAAGLDAGAIYVFPLRDCNENGVLDEVDIAGGESMDCNGNRVPDECEDDCNFNGTPDDCDLVVGTSADCNANAIPDECEGDCNRNEIPDVCEIRSGAIQDCTGNQIPDECESDCDGDGVADACQSSEYAVLSLPVSAHIESYGTAIAIDDDLMAIGVSKNDDAGAVYVYRRSRDEWIFEQELMPEDGRAGAFFGYSLSVSGPLLLAGAPRDIGNGSASGAAYLFRSNEGKWTSEQKLVPDEGTFAASFGESVALQGEEALIGAPNDGPPEARSGSVYVFRSKMGTWQFEQKLVDASGTRNAKFGSAVAMSGSVALIGAPSDGEACNYENPFCDSGAALVFRSDGLHWRQEDRLRPYDNQEGDQFGVSVAVDGNLALVGAPTKDRSFDQVGAGYVFRYVEGEWLEEYSITPCEERGFESTVQMTGRSVALDGGIAAVSHSRFGDSGLSTFSILIYSDSGLSGIMEGQLSPRGKPATADGPWAIAMTNGTLVAAAPSAECPSGDCQAGRVHVFELQQDALGQPEDETAQTPGPVACGQCGSAMASTVALTLLGMIGLRTRNVRHS